MQRKLENDRPLETDAAEPDSWANVPESAEAAQDLEVVSDDEMHVEPEGEPEESEATDEESEAVEDDSEAKEEWHKDAQANHPRPKFSLPKLAAEEQAIVDRWWKEMTPVYHKMKADILLARVIEFLDARPRLFPHLYLHDECLFELGGALRRQGQSAQYIELLKRLRVEQPQTYVECFGYYDNDIIKELTLTGRRTEIPAYFNYFKQYADVDPDNCHKLINWLAWVGYEEELMDIAKGVAIPMIDSPNVIGGDFTLEWVLLREYFPFFEIRDASAEAADKVRQAHQTHLPPGDEPISKSTIHHILKAVGQQPQGWVKDKPPKDKKSYLVDIYWDFIGFLHWEKRCSWVRAIYLADQLQKYFFREEKPQNPFDLREKILDVHIGTTCKVFFTIDGVRSMAFLQAVIHYADYLAYHQAPAPQTRDQVMESCRALFPKVVKAIEGGDSSLRLYPTFEAFCKP